MVIGLEKYKNVIPELQRWREGVGVGGTFNREEVFVQILLTNKFTYITLLIYLIIINLFTNKYGILE